MLEIFCDGSSSGEKGKPIGWGWIITRDQKVLTAGYSWQESGTNNLAELLAGISGLEAVINLKLQEPGEQIVLVSDSLYVIGMAMGKYEPKANIPYAKKILGLMTQLKGQTRWVRGHSVDPRIPWQENEYDSLMNHRADSLAKHGKQEAKKAMDDNLKQKERRHGK